MLAPKFINFIFKHSLQGFEMRSSSTNKNHIFLLQLVKFSNVNPRIPHTSQLLFSFIGLIIFSQGSLRFLFIPEAFTLKILFFFFFINGTTLISIKILHVNDISISKYYTYMVSVSKYYT